MSKEIRRRTYTTSEVRETEKVVTGRRRQTISMDRRRSQSRRTSSVARPEVLQSRERESLRVPYTTIAPSPSPSPPTLPQPRHHHRRLSATVPAARPHNEDLIYPRNNVALIAPERHHRSDEDIRAEIRELEDENRLLRQEREALTPPDVVEVRRDYKGENEPGNFSSVWELRSDKNLIISAPSPRMIRAMMATLT